MSAQIQCRPTPLIYKRRRSTGVGLRPITADTTEITADSDEITADSDIDPRPAEPYAFNAVSGSGVVILTWLGDPQTYDTFVLERKRDGGDYEVLFEALEVENLAGYYFEDSAVESATYQYRLRGVRGGIESAAVESNEIEYVAPVTNGISWSPDPADENGVTANGDTFTAFQEVRDAIANEDLTDFDCSENSLTDLDVSYNVNLLNLRVSVNDLTELDVSNNVALTNLYCDENLLTELDISLNVNLTTLDCHNNAFTQAAIDAVLAALDANGQENGTVDISGMGAASSAGQTSATNLCLKGWTVLLDDFSPP